MTVPTPARRPRRLWLVLIPVGLVLLVCVIAGVAVAGALLRAPPAAPAANTLRIISDLPLSGPEPTLAIVQAMQLRFDQQKGRVCGGRYPLRYESWDDASAAAGGWDPAAETANARRAAADPSVVAYLGPFNSGAAKLSIPILDQAGPLVMLSVDNTYPGLTHALGAAPGEPDVYYPAGLRNFVRLAASDDVQGTVAARFVHDQLQARTVYVIDDQEPYGAGTADAFQAAAGPAGLTVLGRASLDPNANNYQTQMGEISLSNAGRPPDAIFAGLVIENNASQVLKDKVSVMGDNTRVKFIGSAHIQVQAFIDGAGPRVAEGVYATQPGLPFDQLPPASQQFRRDYEARYGGHLSDVNAAFGYEAMNVTVAALEAVCAAGGSPASRRAVRDAVFHIQNFSGALGSWSLDANGDSSLTGTSLFQVRGGKFVAVGPLQ